MTAESVALFLVGVLQPVLQELTFRNKVSDAAAHWLTVAVSVLLALVATWLAGGFASGKVPNWTLGDPAPLLGYLVGRVAPVYALSQVVWGGLKSQIHAVAGTSAPAGPVPAPAPAGH
jgi:p-aminobenzoyl-glutamate transporter AbgT